ncbi:MAG: SPASM domain-containing protein [Novosphingobium sp.]|nr:SPASM domain-containing protein [Novosphingobium sp.]
MTLIRMDRPYRFNWCGHESQIDFRSGHADFGALGSSFTGELPALLPFDRAAHSVELIVVTVSNHCNLGCTYCSVSGGAFAVQTDGPQATPEAICDFIETVFAQSGTPPQVSFMGGEPLLSLETLSAIMDGLSGRSLGEVGFSMPTNLTLLSQGALDVLKRHDVHLLASIDGPRHIHDRNRPAAGGRSSFDRVLKGAELLLDNDYSNVTARPTITEPGEMLEIFLYLEDLGFERILFGMDFVDTSRAYDREEIQKQLKLILDHVASEKSTAGFVLTESLIQQILTRNRKPNWEFLHCGAGISSINIGLDGKLFPCHNYSLKEARSNRVIGDISSGVDSSSNDAFIDHSLVVREACKQCAVSAMCPGGCVYLEEERFDYWLRGECGVNHLPFLEIVEASYYAISAHSKNNPSRFLRKFVPALYRELTDLASQKLSLETA